MNRKEKKQIHFLLTDKKKESEANKTKLDTSD